MFITNCQIRSTLHAFEVAKIRSTYHFTRTWCSYWAMELGRSAGEDVVAEVSIVFEDEYRDEAKDAAVAEQVEECNGSSSDEE